MANITNWFILHKLKPSFLSRVKSFIVFGEKGTEVLLVTNDDCVFGFGENFWGSLGLDHREPVTEPTELVELRGKKVISLVNGAKHVLALTDAGEIYSWGNNNYGQLGNMNTFESLKPILVGKHIMTVACGANHTLALTTGGQVFAWGRNNYGQIGIGSNTNQLVPIKIAALEHLYVKMIACGSSHSVVITNEGQIYAWGSNSFGQLGIGNCTHETSPKVVKLDQTLKLSAKGVACGAYHTMMLMTNGEVMTCGRNEFGQLGSLSVPTSEGSCVPVKISSTNRFRTISAHFATNISVAQSQSEYCSVWGECANEVRPLREPRELPLSSIYDVFAIYSKQRNTPSLLIVDQEEHFRITKLSNQIADKLARLFNDPNSSDLHFDVEGKIIYAHRWFLKISSKYFQRLLSKQWCDPNTNQITINDYSYNIFYAYIRYIYTDCIEVCVDETIELLDLANCYLEDELKQKCVNILRQNILVENCCQFFQLAILYHLEQFLRDIVVFVFNNVFHVCRSAGFRDMDGELCKELMLMVSDIA